IATACASVGNGSTVYVAIDGKIRGYFQLTSTMRAQADKFLHDLGDRYRLALLSGDHDKERDRFRNLFGPDTELHFNQSPLEKLSFSRRLQQAGRKVVMVGDGLNDAGALRQSQVGIAVVENPTAFSPASDVIMAAQMVPHLGSITRF